MWVRRGHFVKIGRMARIKKYGVCIFTWPGLDF